ncbi:hypothetical protein L1887_02932 [Cichorium endivia]|nr:hypothetical protein L1887_25649 [Cichorium endivia]KAI3524279.1 hypothetical protein L1887_02932 [Cichorium endivia]
MIIASSLQFHTYSIIFTFLLDNQSYESDQEDVIDQPVRSEECFDDNHDEEFVPNLHDEVQSVDLNQDFVSNVHDEDEPVDLNQG